MRLGLLAIFVTVPILYGSYLAFDSYLRNDDEEATTEELPSIRGGPNNMGGITGLENGGIEEHRQAKAIHVIGERHSGSAQILSHLEECFGDNLPLYNGIPRGGPKGHEFLFQFDDPMRTHFDSLVIAMFLNPYEWVEAMRDKPILAPVHKGMDWKEFVSKPWTMPRWGVDLNITDLDGRLCEDNFQFHDVVPCDHFLFKKSHARYEHKPGTNGRPYQSITELRSDKVRNFLDTKSYSKVLDMWALRYEDVMSEGTAALLTRIENATGAKANCSALAPQKWDRPNLESDYIGWLNRHIDWDIERYLGYEKVTPHSFNMNGHIPISSSVAQKWPRENYVEHRIAGRHTEYEKSQTKLLDEWNSKEPINGRKIRAIHFIGERHSGTNWIFFHLKDCFGHAIPFHQGITRWKHWFQYDDNKKVHGDSLVIAQFRNVYEWVDAMIHKPYHSPEHTHLDWKGFVTKPWTMKRWGVDLNITDTEALVCQDNFRFNQVSPCTERNVQAVKPHARYELNMDGSGLPYDSIVSLRRDKIINFLNTSTFQKVRDMWSVRYEDFVVHGTVDIVRKIEQVTGVSAMCEPVQPADSGGRRLMQNFDDEKWVSSHQSRKNDMDPQFIEWMNDNVDWDAEALIGYKKWT